MNLRLRLSLWYGTLSALALIILALVGYSASVREQYLTLDRVLVSSARFIETGVQAYGRSYALEADTSGPLKDGVVMVMRTYTPNNKLLARSPIDPGLPVTRPSGPLNSPAPPAYVEVLPLPFVPSAVIPSSNAAFGTILVDGQRWRRYVIQVKKPEKNKHNVGYVEALTPLQRLDAYANNLAETLTKIVLFSVFSVLLIGWLLASSALRPVDRMIRAANRIAQSHDLSQRVHTRPSQDELSRLADTFNKMLSSLEQAWQSQQRFVADASHELRAPLTVMQGNLELLHRYPQLKSTERIDMLKEINREANRLSRLVEDLLLLARSDAGIQLNKQAVDLHKVVANAVKDAQHLVKGHILSLNSQGQYFTVLGDQDRLKQLTLILLDNAIRYSPDQTTIQVSIDQDRNFVIVSIRDSGTGIDPADKPHIFERFYRADRARQREMSGSGSGTGIGLSIAKWIVEQYGAHLWVQQTGPTGTTFCFSFPLIKEEL